MKLKVSNMHRRFKLHTRRISEVKKNIKQLAFPREPLHFEKMNEIDIRNTYYVHE